MEIKEIKDNYWTIDIEVGHVSFDVSKRKAYFYKRRTNLFNNSINEVPAREWSFNDDISAIDVFLVIMKSLHL